MLIPAKLKRFPTKFLKEFVYITMFVPPETILAASIWTASRSFFDANEQLSHTLSHCHYIPRVDEHMQNTFFQRLPRYSEFKGFKKVYPSPVLVYPRFTLVQAYSEMLTMCSSQLQVFEKVSPRCLCEGISPLITPSIDIGVCGWKTEFLFREINIDNVYLG